MLRAAAILTDHSSAVGGKQSMIFLNGHTFFFFFFWFVRHDLSSTLLQSGEETSLKCRTVMQISWAAKRAGVNESSRLGRVTQKKKLLAKQALWHEFDPCTHIKVKGEN